MGWAAFIEGGVAAVIAGTVTHPLDLIKVRMQLQIEPTLAFVGHHHHHPLPKISPLSLGFHILQTEGSKALFSGVSATILRQALYSTTRLGLYDVIKRKMQEDPVQEVNLQQKVFAGLVAGGIGAALGNPADVAMVRMQADGRLPYHLRRNYAGVYDALFQMVKHEKIKSLWTGSGPTIQRAMVVTAAQLATYDQIKENLLKNNIGEDGFGIHVLSSFGAGFVASVASNPIDVIKTRVMNMKVGAGMEPEYKGSLDCAIKTVKAEGPMALYKGFLPTVTRQGPYAVVLFVSLEQIRLCLKNF